MWRWWRKKTGIWTCLILALILAGGYLLYETSRWSYCPGPLPQDALLRLAALSFLCLVLVFAMLALNAYSRAVDTPVRSLLSGKEDQLMEEDEVEERSQPEEEALAGELEVSYEEIVDALKEAGTPFRAEASDGRESASYAPETLPDSSPVDSYRSQDPDLEASYEKMQEILDKVREWERDFRKKELKSGARSLVQNHTPYDKISEALTKLKDIQGGEEEEESDDPIDAVDELGSGLLADSYNKMFSLMQRVNELEKKHTVELARANKKLEKEIDEREKAEAEIRHLSRQLINGIEEAQKKLAQDLHDEFGQTLAALHMGVESLWNAMPPSLSPQKEKLNELIVLIEKLGDKIRSISSDLRPDLLDDLGLVPTLQWYIKEFQDQHPEMKIRFQTVGFKKRLSASEVELTLYRIFQESLNNIVKHAQANEVHVMLTYSYPQVIFMVKDNGMGFDPKRRSKGIGLIGMRERVASANGQIDVRSKTGKGTAIRVEIPVPEPKQDAESQRLSAAVQ